MLAKIPADEYEIVANDFERRRIDMLSDDWTREWKDHCRAILVERVRKHLDPDVFDAPKVEGLF